MFVCNCVPFLTLIVFFSIVSVKGEITSDVKVQQISTNNYNSDSYKEHHVNTSEVVSVQLFYESLCSYCKHFYTTQFKMAVERLSKYLKIQTYPYGNAKTYYDNGKFTFRCQHGPKECYGNKLHACALNIVKNQTQALLYNSCMMDFTQPDRGSNDIAADKCGESMNIDSEVIKACAKGEMGVRLLKDYGEESESVDFQYVPYVLMNGKEWNGKYFVRDVCMAFVDTPPPCRLIL